MNRHCSVEIIPNVNSGNSLHFIKVLDASLIMWWSKYSCQLKMQKEMSLIMTLTVKRLGANCMRDRLVSTHPETRIGRIPAALGPTRSVLGGFCRPRCSLHSLPPSLSLYISRVTIHLGVIFKSRHLRSPSCVWTHSADILSLTCTIKFSRLNANNIYIFVH